MPVLAAASLCHASSSFAEWRRLRSARHELTFAKHGRRPAARAERDAAPAAELESIVRRTHAVGCENGAKHDLHLQRGEARPKAPTTPPAERNPRVGTWRILEEELRPERIGIGVDVG